MDIAKDEDFVVALNDADFALCDVVVVEDEIAAESEALVDAPTLVEVAAMTVVDVADGGDDVPCDALAPDGVCRDAYLS